MTKEENAVALRAAIQSQMQALQKAVIANTGLNVGPGVFLHGAGGRRGPTVERKQPQDGVVRMVSNREQIKDGFVMAGVFAAIGIAASIAMGVAVANVGIAGVSLIIPMVISLGFCVTIIRKFFKMAIARADLLEWPKK